MVKLPIALERKAENDMSVHLLPVDAMTDYARLAELLHAVSARSISADWRRHSESAASEGHIRWQVVAVAECGTIVGYGETGRDPRMEPGHFWLVIVVDPVYRNQGVGTMLYDDVARFAWELGATHLTSEIHDDQCEAVCFAKRRGFVAEKAGDKRVRLRLNITFGVPSSPREAVKARYREFRFEQAVLEAYPN